MADNNADIKLDDPNTWPDDLNSLEDLAKQGIAGGEDDGVVVEDFPADVTLAEKTADDLESQKAQGDGKPGDDKPDDDKAGDGKPGDDKTADDKPGDDKPADDKTGDDKAAAQQKPAEKPTQDAAAVAAAAQTVQDQLTADAAADTAAADDDKIKGVLTRDGEHFLPYQVVVDLKTRNRELEEALKNGNGAAQPAVIQPAAVPANGAQPAAPTTDSAAPAGDAQKPMWQRPETEIRDYLKKVEDDYGEVVAKQELTIMQMQAQAAQDRADRERQAQATQEEKARQTSAVIEQNPLLSAWRDDKQSPWYERASDLHDQLLKNDPGYQQLTMDKQFESLTQKVEAVYGPSPHSKTINKLPDATAGSETAQPHTAAQRVPVDQRLKAAAASPPNSISQIPGGAPPAVSDVEKLEKLSSGQIMGLMESQSVDDMNAFLSEVS